LEKAYGINLDPALIEDHPAIIEIEKGKGRLILSYPHLETPDDHWGNRLFLDILHYLNETSICPEKPSPPKPGPAESAQSAGIDERTDLDTGYRGDPASGISKAKQAAADLIAFGEANLLWNWRKPWLLNWKRGIRGLEYGTLHVTLCRMADLEQKLGSGSNPGRNSSVRDPNWSRMTEELERRTLEFCALAKRLLFEE
jgi:hypothetical protein